jgi:myo-inositol-1(or 4)-monophosphatase
VPRDPAAGTIPSPLTPAAMPPPPPFPDLDDLLATARTAASEVGEFVRDHHADRPGQVPTRRKGEGDFVTEVDIDAEHRLRDLLLGRFPDHGFLGEETEPVRPTAERVWVCDPIDGTSNFAQGLPQFGVSVACFAGGAPVAAALRISPEDRVYSAAIGRGAFCDDDPLACRQAMLDDATVIGVQWLRRQFDPAQMTPILASDARIRVFGSTVVQLCDVAAGRLHANVQVQGRLWDIGAAALVVTEAGALFTDLGGRPIFPVEHLAAERHYPSIAATEPLHGRLVELLRRGADVAPS